MLDHSLNVLTVSSWVLRSVTVDATKVASSAYKLLDSARWLEVSVTPLLSDLSHRISVSVIRRNNREEKSPLGEYLVGP
jgi:hypothetical protein